MNKIKIICSIVILSLGLAMAQTFTGNYILQDDVVKLTLEQQSNAKVIGQLTGNGLSFEIEGELSPDSPSTAYGFVYTDESKYLFAIVLEEPVLSMILFSILENGEPNPDDAETFVFNRVDNLGPNVNPATSRLPTNPTVPATDTTAPTTPTTATTTTPPSPVGSEATTKTPNRLPTINSPATATTPATNAQNQTTATQNPAGSNPLASAPASSNGNPSQNPLVVADPFVGAFEGEGLKLVLSKSGTVYSGSLDFRGSSYPVKAAKQANGLVGNFKVADKLFSFSAAIESGKLTLVSDGAIYLLTKR